MPISAENREKAKIIITASCVVFAILMLVALIVGLVSLASASTRKNKLERQLASINAELELNESNIAYYNSKEFIETYVREYCDMQGEGEISFVGKK